LFYFNELKGGGMANITCEKDLEYYYKTIIGEDIPSLFGSDGYFENKNGRSFLFECKNIKNISDEVICRALIQLWFYEQRFIKKTHKIPSMFVVVSNTEYISFYISDLLRYFNNEFDFSIAPSGAYIEYPQIVERLKVDLNNLYHERDKIENLKNIINTPIKNYKIDNENFHFIHKLLKLYDVEYKGVSKIVISNNLIYILKHDNTYQSIEISDKIMKQTFTEFLIDNEICVSDIQKTNKEKVSINLGERISTEFNDVELLIKSTSDILINDKKSNRLYGKMTFDGVETTIDTIGVELEDITIYILIGGVEYIHKPYKQNFYIKFYNRNGKNVFTVND
jgi:hypothetical protein